LADKKGGKKVGDSELPRKQQQQQWLYDLGKGGNSSWLERGCPASRDKGDIQRDRKVCGIGEIGGNQERNLKKRS